jgi:hypothetical protein
VSARTCQQWQVSPFVMDPSDMARRVVEEQPTGCIAWQPTG